MSKLIIFSILALILIGVVSYFVFINPYSSNIHKKGNNYLFIDEERNYYTDGNSVYSVNHGKTSKIFSCDEKYLPEIINKTNIRCVPK